MNWSGPSSETKDALPPPPLAGSCRLTVVLLCFLGIFQMIILRFNISMGMVCMVDTIKRINATHEEIIKVRTVVEFFRLWDENMQIIS